MTETPTPPAGATSQPPVRRRSNLGTKALIVAVCAFILAFVPFLVLVVLGVEGAVILACPGVLSPFLALPAIIMGTISLFRKGQRKFAAVAIVFALAACPFGLNMMGWSKEEGIKSICPTNLHSIGQVVALYMSRNEDAAPPNLHALIQTQLMSPDGLRCPSVRDSDRALDYFYLPPDKETDGRTIIACDFNGDHRHGRHVLYYDSSATWLSRKDFEAELAKPQNAAFANSLRQAEKTQR